MGGGKIKLGHLTPRLDDAVGMLTGTHRSVRVRHVGNFETAPSSGFQRLKLRLVLTDQPPATPSRVRSALLFFGIGPSWGFGRTSPFVRGGAYPLPRSIGDRFLANSDRWPRHHPYAAIAAILFHQVLVLTEKLQIEHRGPSKRVLFTWVTGFCASSYAKAQPILAAEGLMSGWPIRSTDRRAGFCAAMEIGQGEALLFGLCKLSEF